MRHVCEDGQDQLYAVCIHAGKESHRHFLTTAQMEKFAESIGMTFDDAVKEYAGKGGEWHKVS